MKKIALLIATLGLAAAGAFLTPAIAADQEGCLSDALAAAGQANPAPADACGGASADGSGYGYLDGADDNPDPADGFISVSNDGSQDEDGVCASAQGDPGEEFDADGVAIEDDDETPACNEALPQALADQIAG